MPRSARRWSDYEPRGVSCAPTAASVSPRAFPYPPLWASRNGTTLSEPCDPQREVARPQQTSCLSTTPRRAASRGGALRAGPRPPRENRRIPPRVPAPPVGGASKIRRFVVSANTSRRTPSCLFYRGDPKRRGPVPHDLRRRWQTRTRRQRAMFPRCRCRNRGEISDGVRGDFRTKARRSRPSRLSPCDHSRLASTRRDERGSGSPGA